MRQRCINLRFEGTCTHVLEELSRATQSWRRRGGRSCLMLGRCARCSVSSGFCGMCFAPNRHHVCDSVEQVVLRQWWGSPTSASFMRLPPPQLISSRRDRRYCYWVCKSWAGRPRRSGPLGRTALTATAQHGQVSRCYARDGRAADFRKCRYVFRTDDLLLELLSSYGHLCRTEFAI